MSTRSENDALGCTSHVSRSTITPPSERAAPARPPAPQVPRRSETRIPPVPAPVCGRADPKATLGSAVPGNYSDFSISGRMAQNDRTQIAIRFGTSDCELSDLTRRLSCYPGTVVGGPTVDIVTALRPCHWPSVQDHRPPLGHPARSPRTTNAPAPSRTQDRPVAFARACPGRSPPKPGAAQPSSPTPDASLGIRA